MLLRCYNNISLLGKFHFSDEKLSFISAANETPQDRDKTCGLYGHVAGHIIALFAYREELYLSYAEMVQKVTDDTCAHIMVVKEPVCHPDKHIDIRRTFKDGHNILEIQQGQETVWSLHYSPPPETLFIFDWTQTEDEDFDICLWIHNVIESAERRQILIENNSRHP